MNLLRPVKLPPRRATRAACGTERIVDEYTKSKRDYYQLIFRPNEETDLFYCRCQDEESELDRW